MSYEEIGNGAAQVWGYLGMKGRAKVSSLPRALKIRSAVAYQSIGWLAREGKVQFELNGEKQYVALTPSEAEAFLNSQVV